MAVQGTLNQLTLDVAHPEASDDTVVAEPSISRFKIGVELSSMRVQRYAKEKLKVLLVDNETGEVIAGARGHVQNVSFPVHKKDGYEWTERVHKLKFDEELQLEAL